MSRIGLTPRLIARIASSPSGRMLPTSRGDMESGCSQPSASTLTAQQSCRPRANAKAVPARLWRAQSHTVGEPIRGLAASLQTRLPARLRCTLPSGRDAMSRTSEHRNVYLEQDVQLHLISSSWPVRCKHVLTTFSNIDDRLTLNWY